VEPGRAVAAALIEDGVDGVDAAPSRVSGETPMCRADDGGAEAAQ
jgi:hypothetical protein